MNEEEAAMKIEDAMSKNVAVCVPDETLNEVARIMWDWDCGIVPILADRSDPRLVGVITDRDICMAAYTKGQPLGAIRIGDVMTKVVTTCRAADEVGTAERVMQQAQVHRLPVVDGARRLVGILSLADIARASANGARPRDVTPEELGETVTAIRRSRTVQPTPIS